MRTIYGEDESLLVRKSKPVSKYLTLFGSFGFLCSIIILHNRYLSNPVSFGCDKRRVKNERDSKCISLVQERYHEIISAIFTNTQHCSSLMTDCLRAFRGSVDRYGYHIGVVVPSMVREDCIHSRLHLFQIVEHLVEVPLPNTAHNVDDVG